MFLKLNALTPLVLLLHIWSFQIGQAANILSVFINGHQSHLLVYASVVNILIERGHNLTLITTLDVNGIIFDIENIRWIKLDEKFTSTTVSSTQNAYSGLDKFEMMLKRIRETSKFMDDLHWRSFLNERNKYDLIIVGYLFNDYQLGLGAHFNCPVILIWTGQPIGFVKSLLANPEERWYVPQPYDSHQYQGIKAVVFGWFEKFVEFLALQEMKAIYNERFPSNHYPAFIETRKLVSLIFCNHHSLSEGPIAPLLPGIIEIGGIEINQNSHSTDLVPSSDLTDLTKTDIIYFSFGSRISWKFLPKHFQEIFIQAFKSFPNYTIAWKYDMNCTELELKASLSHVKCGKWWPQSSILAAKQTKLFITHGGKGSISEAQHYGVPMLGISFFGDQKPNIDKMSKRQFGLKLNSNNITIENVVNSMKTILQNNIFQNNIKQFSILYNDRPVNNKQNIIYWVEYVLRYKGARHLQSPAADLYFYELYLLDIFFLIIFSLYVLILSLNFLERKLVCSSTSV